MGLDSTRKAIATEAWSQLVHSLLSDTPPSDMGKEYYHTFPEVGFDALQKQLKRLEIYTYKLGTESIQSRLRSSIHSQVPLPNEHHHRPGIKSVRGSISSSKDDYENEDANEQDIEHIRDDEKRFNRVRDDARSAMFSIPADYENHPIINYSESLRSTGLPKALYELENAYQHLLSYGEAKKLSTLFDELLDLVENKDLHGEEKLTLRIQVLKVVKLVHHYGIDTIRTGVEEELEDMNQKYDDVKKNLALLYRKKGLEVMLRICDAEACQRTISEIIGKAERDQVLYKW
ncbi:hypothetical protein ACET3Z_024914 [Daucus carota]